VNRRDLRAIFKALNREHVRYLVTGGLAVVAHGYVRFTSDLDLFVDLKTGNLRRAVKALAVLGYRPRAPVTLDAFLDPKTRRLWAREKGMVVFALASDKHPATEIDLFVEPPLPFDAAYARRVRMRVAPALAAPFLALRDLLALKRKAGRPQDRVDIEALRDIQGVIPHEAASKSRHARRR
jgi:hypothetical protein